MSERLQVTCPGCGREVIPTLGHVDEDDYEGVVCPNGCDLWEYWR